MFKFVIDEIKREVLEGLQQVGVELPIEKNLSDLDYISDFVCFSNVRKIRNVLQFSFSSIRNAPRNFKVQRGVTRVDNGGFELDSSRRETKYCRTF